MKPRPKMFDDVLVLGGGSKQTNGELVASIGGWFAQPDLALSYLLAARHVIEAGEREKRLNEIALPAAYLQRHALELALKHVIRTARSIKESETWLQRIQVNPEAEADTPQEVPFEHDLTALTKLVRRDLAAIDFETPPQVDAASDRLTEVERSQPERLRYLSLSKGGRSFPDEEEIRVRDTQDLLEALFEQVFVYQGHDSDHQNLITQLTHESMRLDQAILRIVPLERL